VPRCGYPLMPSRSNAPPSGSATSFEPPAAVGVFTGEPQSMPAQRVLVAERQLGHEVPFRVEQVGARLPPDGLRDAAHLHPRRHMLDASARSDSRPGARARCAASRRLSPDSFAGEDRAARRRPSERYGSFSPDVPPYFRGGPIGPGSSPRGRRVCGDEWAARRHRRCGRSIRPFIDDAAIDQAIRPPFIGMARLSSQRSEAQSGLE
jgi:hypothetical protein